MLSKRLFIALVLSVALFVSLSQIAKADESPNGGSTNGSYIVNVDNSIFGTDVTDRDFWLLGPAGQTYKYEVYENARNLDGSSGGSIKVDICFYGYGSAVFCETPINFGLGFLGTRGGEMDIGDLSQSVQVWIHIRLQSGDSATSDTRVTAYGRYVDARNLDQSALTVAQGGTVDLTFNALNGVEGRIYDVTNGGYDVVDPNGPSWTTPALTETTTYYFSARGPFAGGWQWVDSNQVTVTVNPVTPPPGAFSITGSGCFGWPSPQVELNNNQSSGASTYTLQRRQGSGSWSDIVSGLSYAQMDSFADSTVAQNQTYEYRMIAVNSSGSTTSANTNTVTTSAANCGAVAPTVDIKANNSNGPITINYNTSATLSWTSTNANSCTASNAWSGSKLLNSSQTTGNLTSSKTYTLTCSNDVGSIADSVTVNVGAAPPPPPPNPVDDAQCVSQNGPPSTMTPGQSVAVSVTMVNTGNTTWTSGGGYKLGSQNPQDNTTWGFGRVPLPTSVSPGGNATYNFNVTAPSAPGSYNFQWKSVREGVAWFGQLCPNVAVTVIGTPPGASTCSVAYMGQTGTVTVAPGQWGNVTWTATNSDNSTLYRDGAFQIERLGADATTGTYPGYPPFATDRDTEFKVIAQHDNNVYGDAFVCKVFVRVSAPIIPPTVSLTADTYSVEYGGSTTVRYSSTNAAFCTSSWSGSQGLSGSFGTGPLYVNTGYSFTCYDSQGGNPAEKNILINVGAASRTVTASINSGSGTITGPGISCPGDCSESYVSGTWVTLIATPSSGHTFNNWVGSCAGQTSSCTLFIDGNKTAHANFTPPPGASTCSVAYMGQTGTVTVAPGQWGNVTWTATNSDNSTLYRDGAFQIERLGADATTGTYPGYPPFATDRDTEFKVIAQHDNNVYGDAFVCKVFVRVASTPPPPPFNYSLSNSGSSNVTKTSGNAYTQNTITKTLVAGNTESVTLSLSGVPANTSYVISGSTCSPTCTSTITFTVTPSTPTGTYAITVTGTPLGKQTSFNLVVAGSPITISCAAASLTALLNQTVTWTATVSGGTPPLTYRWSGTNIPTNPAPSTNPYSRTYSTIGAKTAAVTVTDSDALQTTCPTATVQINFNPKFEEF